MSENKENNNCYKQLIEQLEAVETNLHSLYDCMCELKEKLTGQEEECPDEKAADKAAYEAIQDICLESLLDIKPKGDA